MLAMMPLHNQTIFIISQGAVRDQVGGEGSGSCARRYAHKLEFFYW